MALVTSNGSCEIGVGSVGRAGARQTEGVRTQHMQHHVQAKTRAKLAVLWHTNRICTPNCSFTIQLCHNTCVYMGSV